MRYIVDAFPSCLQNMRKEVLVAIFIGAVLGLAIAFGIWRANQALGPQEPIQTEQPVATEESHLLPLIVTQPEDGAVFSTEKIVVQGSASPRAIITILTNTEEVILEAGDDGTFSQEIGLEGGANQIKVIAHDNSGNRSEKSFVVVYSTEFPPAEQEEEEEQ